MTVINSILAAIFIPAFLALSVYMLCVGLMSKAILTRTPQYERKSKFNKICLAVSMGISFMFVLKFVFTFELLKATLILGVFLFASFCDIKERKVEDYVTRPRRLKTLGDDYTPESISKRIEASWRNEEVDIPKQEYPAYEMWEQSIPEDYRTVYIQFVTVVSVVKSRPDSNRNLYKLLGDEIRKLDRLIEQQNLLCSNDIDTGEQLNSYKDKCKFEVYELTEARSKLRSMLKTAQRQGNEEEMTELKDDISNLSARLKKLRRDILVCNRIEEQQPKIEEKIDKAKESNMKEMKRDEQFRRRR